MIGKSAKETAAVPTGATVNPKDGVTPCFAVKLDTYAAEGGIVLAFQCEDPANSSVTLLHWPHVKMVSEYLGLLVQRHEKRFGRVPLTEGDARSILALRAELACDDRSVVS